MTHWRLPPVAVAVVFAVAVAAYHLVIRWFSTDTLLLLSTTERLGELTGIGSVVVLGCLLFWLVRPSDSGPAPECSEAAIWGIAAAHVVMVLLAGTFVTGWQDLLDDQEAYTLIARLLSEGRAIEPSFVPRDAVNNMFIVDVGADLDHWASCYPLLAGLLTLPGYLIGFPNLVWVAFGGVVVIQVDRLAREIWPQCDRLMVALVTAFSPMLIGTNTIFHTVVPAMLFSVLLLRLGLACIRGVRYADLGMGFFFGLLVMTRPLEALTMLVVGLAAGVVFVRRNGVGALMASGVRIAVGGLLPALMWLTYNHAVTGDPLRMPYDLLTKDGPLYGFGRMYGVESHTVVKGVAHRVFAMGRFAFAWAFAGPLAMLVTLIAFVEYRSDRRILAVLGIGAAHLLLHIPVPFGPMYTVGPFYRVWTLPLVILLVAALSEQDFAGWRRRVGITVAFGWLTFVVTQVGVVHTLSRFFAEPTEQAEELAAANGPLVVFHTGRRWTKTTGKVFFYPIPRSSTDPVLWVIEQDGVREMMREIYPDRRHATISWAEAVPFYTPQITLDPDGS